MDHAEIISLLGGPVVVAKAVGCDRTRVLRWRAEGIPPRRWPKVVEVARAKGLAGITLDALNAGWPDAAKPEAA